MAAGEKAAELGYGALMLTSSLQGEAREVAQVLAAVGREIRGSGHPIVMPACVLAGGETTVTIRGSGKGGRNQELALAAAAALAGSEGIAILSAGTDGTDGPTDAAGAYADGATCSRGLLLGMDPRDHLQRNDAYPFFAALDDLLSTGPTRTNVMDLIVMIVE
jgi:hydroxypyruvate reductase